MSAFEFQIRFSIHFQRSYIHSEIIPALYILSKRINLKLKENLSKKEQNMNLFSFSISFDINFVLWWVFFVLNWVCWLPSSSRTWYYYQTPNIFKTSLKNGLVTCVLCCKELNLRSMVFALQNSDKQQVKTFMINWNK